MCGAGRASRGRGAADDGLLARPDRPSRCTLPITAFRVTLPSSAAIWLAESPASQSFFNCSTRSSDQVITVIALLPCSSRQPLEGGRDLQIFRRPPCRFPALLNPSSLAGIVINEPGRYA